MKAQRKPGFKMSDRQFHLFLRLWAEASQAQGWDKLSAAQREEKRHEVLAALGYSSLKLVDMKTGFGRVMQCLLELAGKVPAPHTSPEPQDDPDARKRLLHRAGERTEMLIGIKGADWVLAVLKDRFKLINGWRSIVDLPNKELVNLLRTVNTRIAEAKQKEHEAIPV